ncbi:MAG: hypothetical protein ACLGJD_23060, partial [Gammaproteobacteria bacterium]
RCISWFQEALLVQQIESPGLALVEPQGVRAIPSTLAPRFEVARDPLIDVALARPVPVYVGVSGGKDSQALAYRVQAHLDKIGHAGPRALIHSDLGRIEWWDSAPVCERLAERLGWELVTASRRHGGSLVVALGRERGALPHAVVCEDHHALEFRGPAFLHQRTLDPGDRARHPRPPSSRCGGFRIALGGKRGAGAPAGGEAQ